MTLQHAEDGAPAASRVLDISEALRRRLTAATSRDAEAYDGVLAAFRAPRSDDAQRAARKRRIQEALCVAAAVPLDAADAALEILRAVVDLAPVARSSTASDLEVASHLAHAAVLSAIANVEINRASIKDVAEQERLGARCRELRSAAEESYLRALEALPA